MVIQIETAQNGFVVRDTKQEDAAPIIVESFNNLVGVLVQAFNVKLENQEGNEGAEENAEEGAVADPVVETASEKTKRTGASA